MKYRHQLPLTLLTVAMLSACTSLPASGPRSGEVEKISSSPNTSSLGIELVEISPDSVSHLGTLPAAKVHLKGDVSGRPSMIRNSDVLVVRIWEANPDGLFSTPESPATPIQVTVSDQGTVFIPYAGEISASGKSLKSIRNNILSALQGKVIDPQVQVDLKSSTLSTVSITGGVGQPGQYPLVRGNSDLLQVLSLAGGSRAPKHETRVSLLRDEITQEVMLSDVFDDSTNNVTLIPGDVVELNHLPKRFTAFGAVIRHGQIDFSSEKMTLEQAIALSGGLNDQLANARGIFLFRMESSARLKNAGLIEDVREADVPTIYQLDMTRPESFFLSRSFELQDNDILYVENSSAVGINQFISSVVGPLLGSAAALQSINQ